MHKIDSMEEENRNALKGELAQEKRLVKLLQKTKVLGILRSLFSVEKKDRFCSEFHKLFINSVHNTRKVLVLKSCLYVLGAYTLLLLQIQLGTNRTLSH